MTMSVKYIKSCKIKLKICVIRRLDSMTQTIGNALIPIFNKLQDVLGQVSDQREASEC